MSSSESGAPDIRHRACRVRGVRSRRARGLAALIVGLALAVAIAPSATALATTQDAPWEAQLGGIEATGLKHVTSAQLIALSGLKVGQIFGPEDIAAARQRLLKTGLFTSIGYRYRNVGYLLIVIFECKEVAWQTPVVFDNFVERTDAQLVAAVARDVPSFDGLAPDQDAVLARLARALERVAREANDPGTVAYSMVYEKARGVSHWRFHLDRASGPLPMCAIEVSGLPPAADEAVRARAATLVGTDYSRDLLTGVARETLVPALAALRIDSARVTRIEARREPPRAGCERGVSVVIVMDAGGSSSAR